MSKQSLMEVVRFPDRDSWEQLVRRPLLDQEELLEKVNKILSRVKKKGDKALFALTKKFDGVEPEALEVSQQEIGAAIAQVPFELREAMATAARNIEVFHQAQLQEPAIIETMPGVRCWRASVPIEKVGLYVPGGSAPLFSSILMLAIPARIAGCREVILCSPPGPEGKLHPAVVYAAQLTGVSRMFKVGGAQAIAAMAYGTRSIPRADKLFGPGNQYVTCAKQLVQQEGVAIDMPAGPSEVAIFADETANPAFVAADLLSQAEHGPDSQVMLVTTHEPLIALVQAELKRQLDVLPRKQIAGKALAGSRIVLVSRESDATDLLNAYAAEHLILACARPREMAAKVISAGSVFLGHYSPESVGDYASGTNHTLPTNGYARAYSGVSVDSFVKKITYQELTPSGLAQIGPAVELMATAEGLEAHRRAVEVRMAAAGDSA